MKFTLAILLFGLFAFCLSEATSSEEETDFGDAIEKIEKKVVGKLEGKLDLDSSPEDEDEDVVEYELYEKKKDDEEKNKEEGDENKSVERKKREALEIATRFVRNAAQYHLNIVSEMHKTFNALRRR